MSEFLKILPEAIIQGLTEFLPVSSSGHLVLVDKLFGHGGMTLMTGAMLHLGTLGAVIVYYWKQIVAFLQGLFRGAKESWHYFLCLALSTIVTGAVGILFASQAEEAFSSLHFVAFMWLITAVILFLTDKRTEDKRPLTVTAALFIGLAQAVAIFPGISRSGITLAAALLLGLKRKEALQYIFFISIPAIAGGALFSFKDGWERSENFVLPVLLFGAMVAGIVGYFSIKLLVAVTQKGRLRAFSLYLFILAFLVLLTYTL
ncbi:MAG TPA: undecaprenyl-diphosphate phosphatase [Candidatus Mcinerneyibacteriales bacterium]|nr:undecaprenyl-diphosphate phosphatase [Candidatus Mcinerneyibacteriales bacterium]HPJ70917.1 undecaprenyl-diphosphate phosphatase [Candidatus Mcinerneyibacteriales bacterium]